MRNVEREARYEKDMRRLGEFIESLDYDGGLGSLEGATLLGVVVRMATRGRPDVLIVIKASVEGTQYVAFVGALSLAQAVLTWRSKSLAGTIKWREDQPWVGGS